ncbi:10028_t:CDS:1, partial [Entrophospora sp. SA101]
KIADKENYFNRIVHIICFIQIETITNFYKANRLGHHEQFDEKRNIFNNSLII